MHQIKIVGISGSLRKNSSNTNILKSIAAFAPAEVSFHLFEGLEDLPHFNPEKEDGTPAVQAFRKLIQEANGIIICTPEYAFGVPGSLKNALDWLVSSNDINEKPVAAISASPTHMGGDKALASLLLTLSALGTNMNEKSALSIAAVSKKIGNDGKVNDEDAINQLKSILDNLLEQIDMGHL